MTTDVWNLEKLGIKLMHVGDGDYVLRANNGHTMFLTNEAISQLHEISQKKNDLPVAR